MEFKECTKCCVMETQDSIRFDEDGQCNVCNQINVKQEVVNWDERLEMLDKLIAEYKGEGQYDCIVPFSGGKDSTYTLYYIVNKLKLRPLVVCFDHGFYRPQHIENRNRTINRLGVDFITFRPSWKIRKELMLESLKRKGDFCWHCHCGVYVYPIQIALKYKIPLIFWGQPDAEYGSYGYTYEQIQEVDEKQFNRFINLGITAEDMHGMLPDWVAKEDLMPFSYPDKKDLRDLKVRSVHLGSFIAWDPKSMAEEIREVLDWKYDEVEGIPPEYGYEKVECMFNGVRDYLKYIKRGFARTRHLVSIDIRDGRLDRETAKKLIAQYDGKRPASLDTFLRILNLSEDEFLEIAMEHCVAPHVHDPSKVEKAEPLWDQGKWDHTLGV